MFRHRAAGPVRGVNRHLLKYVSEMHDVPARGLTAGGYVEHPTMYFARRGKGPEKWKSIMVDQDRQEAEVAIGLGGSSSCRTSEAITDVCGLVTVDREAGRVALTEVGTTLVEAVINTEL